VFIVNPEGVVTPNRITSIYSKPSVLVKTGESVSKNNKISLYELRNMSLTVLLKLS
jgi:hypothetical protein